MHTPSRTRQHTAALLTATAALAVLLAACVPTAPSVTTTTTTSTTSTTASTTSTVPEVPTLVVDPTPQGLAAGSTVTVTGSGYDPTAYVGTRPPLAGQPSGVYVVLARLGDPWRPSQGAPASSRQIISQVWALPQAQHDALDPDGSNPAIVVMSPEGGFTAELTLTEAVGSGSYAIATYPGSGAVNATAEVSVPVSFAAAD